MTFSKARRRREAIVRGGCNGSEVEEHRGTYRGCTCTAPPEGQS